MNRQRRKAGERLGLSAEAVGTTEPSQPADAMAFEGHTNHDVAQERQILRNG